MAQYSSTSPSNDPARRRRSSFIFMLSSWQRRFVMAMLQRPAVIGSRTLFVVRVSLQNVCVLINLSAASPF